VEVAPKPVEALPKPAEIPPKPVETSIAANNAIGGIVKRKRGRPRKTRMNIVSPRSLCANIHFNEEVEQIVEWPLAIPSIVHSETEELERHIEAPNFNASSPFLQGGKQEITITEAEAYWQTLGISNAPITLLVRQKGIGDDQATNVYLVK